MMESLKDKLEWLFFNGALLFFVVIFVLGFIGLAGLQDDMEKGVVVKLKEGEFVCPDTLKKKR